MAPAERKSWLEQAKARLQQRLAEIEQELRSLNNPNQNL
ncbi:MAG: DUF5320 domain-containing protein [Chloroflexi bacterium]|nr:DUF5320 domain-containing protein [Chloroflexota bacterium]